MTSELTTPAIAPDGAEETVRAALSPGGPGHAYETIRGWIIEGRLSPGERLVEQRIAEELGLSRTPVREAVRMLTTEGLAVAEPHRGAVVRTLGRGDVLDLYELRARLESYAAELAADRHSTGDLEEIDGGIDDYARAMGRLDLEPLQRTRQISEANRRVHAAIIKASGHERLGHLLAHTVDAPLVFNSFRHFDAAQLERSNQFHAMIRRAIGMGEGTRAAGLMREHILQGRDQILLGMAQEPDGDDAAAGGE